MKKHTIYILLACLSFAACKKLDQKPQSTASKEAIFGSETGLKLYTNAFYNMGFLPRNSTAQDAMSDYLAVKSVPDFIREGGFSASNSSGWSWGDLRTINYFIQNCTDPNVPAATRKNYLGLARYYRAYFYYDKVKRFGDVPWINKALDPNDPAVYAGRDKRELVMDSVLADLDYACTNLPVANDASRTSVTKWVAYALKSRICLFEGTYRKYHTELNLTATADKWLNETITASDAIIKNGGYSINTAGGPGASYRAVFTPVAPLAAEVLQAAVADVNLGILSEANWWWTSGTYGAKASFTRTFINTYLKLDGTPFTNTPGYETMLFKDEVKGRDLRLKQTIRLGDYKRLRNGVAVPAPPVFSYTFTGYQPIKMTLDDESLDNGALNTNAVPLFRYAEVLLNFAEAKAELGTLTDAEWAATIGVLRARGGITGGLTTKPTIADPYLVANYFPGITDPTILEIRRERGIELSLEGVRFADILRWKRGELMTQVWNGFYVPAVNTPMDLNEDGTPDVYFYQGAAPPQASRIASVTYVDVNPKIGTATNSQLLKNGTSGELIWMNEIPRKWTDKNYLYPIPLNDYQMNPKLGQNPGWQ